MEAALKFSNGRISAKGIERILSIGRSILEQEFYSDKFLVYGHTPTQILHKQLGESPTNDIIFYKSQIAIDCGCGFGGPLGCLCLDTMESFYF